PAMLGATAGPSNRLNAPRPSTTSGTWRSLIWLIVLAVLGGGAFLVISTGSFGSAGNKLRGFFSRELTSFLGPLRRRRNNRKTQ
ncbi:MAG: stage II sporulation protein P, partial [Bacillota bacterium]